MSPLVEHEDSCPFCNETITFLIDASQNEQSYIEDCSVCCRPIQVTTRCDPDSNELLGIDLSRS
ncbi:MAG: CPXCG motif-containing cysteine-rich protein [Bdellovibrionales bacterium]|nr:CPXCG motif-containing cysteine-rich protein [Bdellovibrionales bacterium]